MKTNSYLKTAFLPLCLMAFMLILVFTSCQKDTLGELPASGLDAPDTQSPLALEKRILEINFLVATDELTDDQILQQYKDLMGQLSEADRTMLIDLVQAALAQESEYDGGPMITPRTTESILSSGMLNDLFGVSVYTEGNKVYVGASRSRKVYEYAKTGGTYTLLNEITPDPTHLNFGSSISLSGSWMAVGASGGDGKVFMFKKQGNAWIQKDILTGPAGNFSFGTGRGISLKGNTLAVMSLIPNSNLQSTISVFTLSGNAWSLQQEFNQPGFRHASIKLDVSENRIATASALNNFFGSPRTLIYVRNGSNWTLEDEVIIDVPGVFFCLDVAIEGNTIVLPAGAPGYRHFAITNNGGNWEFSQELVTPEAPSTAARWAQIEGGKIIIGAPSSNNAIPDAVHVFEYFGSYWDFTETLTPSDLGVNVRIESIALEGNTIVAGCLGSSVIAGKAFVFED